MQLSLILDKYKNLTPTKNIGGKRADIIKEFVDEINLERLRTKYRSISPVSVAIKLSHLNESDLLYFLKDCKRYKLENKSHSFSKMFFGSLKLK